MNHLAPITTYGCIAEHLGHSFSGEIHRLLSQALAAKDDRLAYQYHLQELRPDEVEGFFRRRAFCGINITIPYKQVIIPMLDELTDVARDIGAVNTAFHRPDITDAIRLTQGRTRRSSVPHPHSRKDRKARSNRHWNISFWSNIQLYRDRTNEQKEPVAYGTAR